MRKTQTSLTYKPLKTRALFQVIKKIFWGQKSPVRLLYENGWGTTINPLEEVSYIAICVWETFKIIWIHNVKKFPGVKNGL